MAHDERFATLAARTRHIDLLYSFVGEQIALHSTAHWQQAPDDNDIPNSPMASLNDLPDDPYLQESGFFSRYEHPTEGPLVRTAIPQQFSATPAEFRLPPPTLGQHTAEVLENLMTFKTLKALKHNTPPQ